MAVCVLCCAALTLPRAVFAGSVRVSLNPAAFPAGEYEAVQTHDNTAQKTKDAKQYAPSRMENTFTFDVRYAPPTARAAGRMDFTLRRVQIRINAGGAYAYDSAGDPRKQTPILTRQFKYIVGVTSSAAISPDGTWGRFQGLDAGWDKFGLENPGDAAAVKMNKGSYGDARVARMLARGREFLPADGELQSDRTWKVKKTVPGIANKPAEAEHTCKLVDIDNDLATIEVTWHVNGFRPEFTGGEMTMFGGDIKGSTRYTFHAPSGMLVAMNQVIERTDQFARRENGRGMQQTTRSTEKNTFVLRRKPAAAGAVAAKATHCVAWECPAAAAAEPANRRIRFLMM